MAFARREISPEVQAELRVMSAAMRRLLYGETECPAWGTRFREIEGDAMSVGLELARLVIEDSVAEQAQRMPASAMAPEDDEARPAGTKTTPIETEAGRVTWEQPRAELKKGRKAFFPPAASVGAEGG